MALTTPGFTAAGSTYFPDGMDSGTLPSFLRDTQYQFGINTVQRGGIVQTRPGYRTLFGAPCGYPQGVVFFQPTNSPPCLVWAVDGIIYYSAYNNGWQDYQILPNVRFSPNYKNIYWAVCSKFSARDSTGTLIYLDQPINVLVMQDGVSRAAYWDGQNSAHLNPTPSPKSSNFSPPGFDGTPVGEVMAWAGNRLWVSRGKQVFASDFGDPLKFKEASYLNLAPSFLMPENVTGMVQPTINSPLFIFGPSTNTTLNANIQQRELWTDPSQAPFQVTDTNIGCVSHRSVVKSFGVIWWYSAYGITNFNQTLRERITSAYIYQDNQMGVSSSNLSPDLSGICGLAFENYLLMSVPSGDRWNRETWVFDQQSTSQNNSGWASIWTGTRPVEWATGVIDGEGRAWYLSCDRDGVNRIWEAFDDSRTDNGCPITCAMQTKAHNYGSKNLKRFHHADIFLSEVYGDLNMNIRYACERGAYVSAMTKSMVATIGVFGSVPTFNLNSIIQSFKPQTRYLRTEQCPKVDDCNMCGIESGTDNNIGTEFSLLLTWSGRAAVNAYRIFVQEGIDDKFWGACEDDEVGPRVLTAQGCSTLDNDTDNTPFPTFVDQETVILTCPDGEHGTPSIGTATRTSIISENDATEKAACAAFQDALSFLDCNTGSTAIETVAGQPMVTVSGEPIFTV